MLLLAHKQTHTHTPVSFILTTVSWSANTTWKHEHDTHTLTHTHSERVRETCHLTAPSYPRLLWAADGGWRWEVGGTTTPAAPPGCCLHTSATRSSWRQRLLSLPGRKLYSLPLPPHLSLLLLLLLPLLLPTVADFMPPMGDKRGRVAAFWRRLSARETPPTHTQVRKSQLARFQPVWNGAGQERTPRRDTRGGVKERE